jgi:hypothetical protein
MSIRVLTTSLVCPLLTINSALSVEYNISSIIVSCPIKYLISYLPIEKYSFKSRLIINRERGAKK